MEIDNKKCKTCVHYNEQCVLDDLETCRFKKKHESFLHNDKLLKYAYSKDNKDIYNKERVREWKIPYMSS